eukprot:4785527-Amphidinium_carterae.1
MCPKHSFTASNSKFPVGRGITMRVPQLLIDLDEGSVYVGEAGPVWPEGSTILAAKGTQLQPQTSG